MSDDVEIPEGLSPLPDVAELKKEVSRVSHKLERDQEEIFKESFERRSIKSERDYIHLLGLKDHYSHKGRWSIFLMILMAGMIVFQSVLLGLVGAGIWSFEKYAWLLPALLAQNLAQIVGLAVFVVKALFKDIERDKP